MTRRARSIAAERPPRVERLPLAELVILEGVGHNPLLEAPDTLREQFLEGA